MVDTNKNDVMLKLTNISKIYRVANTSVNALNDVSLSFRKNEFVSILGPSGSGKTTLLNIIGGLDHYTKGDLIILGKSTKDFKDRDWDHYRNLRIGFIFQAYNLIPHQTVLSNVELALTISGVDKEERRKRAIEALEEVGLHDQIYKKPNQLSGGQCQRVAIARALINNPEILLADEPTGALDTKTSKQIMDLIKEISKDRLVVMVTHNPELAEQYSTRIISLRDGKIENDSNPIEEGNIVTYEEKEVKTSKAKMSFLTAVKLSFKNLLSKRGRTILVSIASSIGIIGVSTVLAISFGVTNYISSMQDDMLSSYPVSVAEEAVDYSSLISGLDSTDAKVIKEFDINTQVGMDSMVNYLMDKYTDLTNVKTNDINENFIKFIEEMPGEYTQTVKYNYGIDVTNNIFCDAKMNESSPTETISLNGLTQRYISELKTVKGFSNYAQYVDLFTNFMNQMPNNSDYILSQYDLLGSSKLATNSDEIMLVVDNNTTLTDLVLAQLGFYNHDEFINIAKKSIKVNEANKEYENSKKTDADKKALKEKLAQYDKDYPYKTAFNYTDLIGKEFYYYPEESLWQYGNVSTDIKLGGTLIYISASEMMYLTYSEGVLSGYSIPTIGSGVTQLSFVSSTADVTNKSTFLKGHWTEKDVTDNPKTLDIDYVDIMGTITPSITYYNGSTSQSSLKAMIAAEEYGFVDGYYYKAVVDDTWKTDFTTNKGNKMKITGILRAKSSTKFGSLTRGVYYTKALTDKYIADACSNENKILFDPTNGFKKFYTTPEVASKKFPAYVTYSYYDYSVDDKNPVKKDGGYAYALNGDLSNSVSSLFSGLMGGTSYVEQNQVYLRSLTGLKAEKQSDNKELYDYEMKVIPQQIDFYPLSFSDKDNVTSYLDKWNANVDITLKDGTVLKYTDRSELTYTDTVQMIISVINTLIRIVTSALVAFTSLSLVVSCFMIAVITYISVLERVKEIGVIRSLGGRKKDVIRLFTAENLMTGLASGVIGIAVTYLISLIINLAVRVMGVPTIAALPWWVALIMIGVSILLNVLSGAIPSRKAAKQDPVEALRSE